MTVDEAHEAMAAAIINLDKARLDYHRAVVKAREATQKLSEVLASEIKKPVIEITDFEAG